MKINLITILLVAFLVVQLPTAVHAAPTLTCTIEQPLNPPSGSPVSYDASNEGYIVMDAAIDTKGGGNLAGSGAIGINPPANNLPPSYLLITATNSSGASVPINAKITGDLSGTGGYVITFFLPEDATTRTTKEQAFIDNAKATDNGSPASAATWVNANNAKALAAVDKIYTQSQVGAFTITVKYVSSQSGLWNGTVQSTPIIANVLNKGSILDGIH